MKAYVIKTEVSDPSAETMRFDAQKTMYGGKKITAGHKIYIFASETQGGQGLVAAGVVTAARALPKPSGVDRWTPRVSVEILVTSRAVRRLGRFELKHYDDWNDGRPETELNSMFYRQSTNKIGGVEASVGVYLQSFCAACCK